MPKLIYCNLDNNPNIQSFDFSHFNFYHLKTIKIDYHEVEEYAKRRTSRK